MCYNASYLEKKKEKLAERYKSTLPANWNDQIKDFDLPTRYLASGFDHPEMVVITSNGISLMEWGLIPHWAKDKTIQNSTLNAKSETIFELPSFKNIIETKRCILPVSGFFESKEINKIKYPHFIQIEGKALFSLACVYDSWIDNKTGERKNTFSIITTEANDFMAEIHNVAKRMPLILNEEGEKKWVNPLSNAEIIALMRPYHKTDLIAHMISKEANNTKINRDKPEILKPFYYPELQQQSLF